MLHERLGCPQFWVEEQPAHPVTGRYVLVIFWLEPLQGYEVRTCSIVAALLQVDAQTDVQLQYEDDAAHIVPALLEELARYRPEIKTEPAPEAVDSPDISVPARGPRVETLERAKLYKSIKEKHPDWSYARVAIEANKLEGSTRHSDETVRNTYRAMDWPWERADRIR